MKYTSLCFLTLFSLSFLLQSCDMLSSQEEPTEEPTAMSNAEIKELIKAMEDTLGMAYNEKNIQYFERFYAKDAITYGEGREQLFGKKEIVNHFKKNIVNNPDYNYSFKYFTLDVFAEGEYATENGRWEEYDSSGAQIDHGFYMVVFKKEDGRYKSIRDIWNSSTSGLGEENTEE